MEHFEFISGRPIALSVPQQKLLLDVLLSEPSPMRAGVKVGGGTGHSMVVAEGLEAKGLLKLLVIRNDDPNRPTTLAAIAPTERTHTAPDSPAGLGTEWGDKATDLLDQLAVAALRRKVSRDLFDAQQFSRPDADGNRRRPRRGGQVGVVLRAQRWAAMLEAPGVSD